MAELPKTIEIREEGPREGFQFEEKLAWVPALNIGYHVGIDGISLFFVLLSTLLTPICILASWESIQSTTSAKVPPKSSRRCQMRAPAMNSITTRMATKIRAVPRSGCLKTSAAGNAANAIGTIRSRMRVRRLRRLKSWARPTTSASFANSEGCS